MATEKNFYTYIHCKPDGDPFYVGKGCGNRGNDLRNGRNSHHQSVIDEFGEEQIKVLVFNKESEEAAFESEIHFIKMLRDAGYELSNKSNGGEGKAGSDRAILSVADFKISKLNRLEKVIAQIESVFIERDKLIYEIFTGGVRQKALAKVCNLSPSRVKAICLEQKKLAPIYSGEWPIVKDGK